MVQHCILFHKLIYGLVLFEYDKQSRYLRSIFQTVQISRKSLNRQKRLIIRAILQLFL
jgi:hypothetical protein